MAHLLMIESWVGASGKLLPPLLNSLGHTYTFITRKKEHYQNSLSDEKHPVFQYADTVLVTETNDIDHLIKTLRPFKFDGVITVCDYYIETAKEIAKAFCIPSPFPEEIKNVRQKHLMRQALDAAQLANPRYGLANTWEEIEQVANNIGYPLVIKPVDLASSAFVNFIANELELKESYKKLEEFPLNFRDQERNRTFLLEEYMEGKEVSVESISYNGETTILGITDKSITGTPYFIENGHMFPAQLNSETSSTIIEFVQDALKAVGYDQGIAHTEVKITPEGPRIVEINPRTAGNYIVELIERVTGINLLYTFVELALGQKPTLVKKDCGISSAAVMFLVPPHAGVLTNIHGIDSLKSDKHIVRYKIEDCIGKYIDSPIDNACYLGHLITQDTEGFKARTFAEDALDRIVFNFKKEGE